jgi:hypothetical protein
MLSIEPEKGNLILPGRKGNALVSSNTSVRPVLKYIAPIAASDPNFYFIRIKY